MHESIWQQQRHHEKHSLTCSNPHRIAEHSHEKKEEEHLAPYKTHDLLAETPPGNSRGTIIKISTAISRVASFGSCIESLSHTSCLAEQIPVHSSTVLVLTMISRLLQLKCTSTITIKPDGVPSSSPNCNHGNKSLHNSIDFPIKILNHGRTPKNTFPIKFTQSLTNGIQIDSGIEGNPASYIESSNSWW